VLDWLGSAERSEAPAGPRLMRFEVAALQELGYTPALEACAACGGPAAGRVAFSCEAGGVVCPACAPARRDRRPLSPGAREMLRALRPDGGAADAWRGPWPEAVRREVRGLLGQYVTFLMGRRPRLLPYLGS
jgi:recombinational DNA repair protein (RecF pathway)